MDTLCLFNDIFLRMAILYFVAKIKPPHRATVLFDMGCED